MTQSPVCLWEAYATLGEGPCWDARTGELVFVDIKGPAVHRLRLGDGRRLSWTPPARVSAIVPRGRGGYVAATDQGFAFVDLDAGTFAVIVHPEADVDGNRFNDGKLDARGRFWAGTMDDRELEDRGALYCLSADHSWQRWQEGYRVTNGPAFAPDGLTMYHNDSGRRLTYALSLDDDGLPTGERRVLAHFTNADGYPDGMTVDAEGCLWVCFWDGWAVRRLSPDGRMVSEHVMPVQRPTSCAFGGEGLDRLFVTSARVGLNADALDVQPLAGGLFELAAGVKGIAPGAFGG